MHDFKKLTDAMQSDMPKALRDQIKQEALATMQRLSSHPIGQDVMQLAGHVAEATASLMDCREELAELRGKVAGMKEDAAAVFGLFELSTMIIIELIKLRNRVRELEQ